MWSIIRASKWKLLLYVGGYTHRERERERERERDWERERERERERARSRQKQRQREREGGRQKGLERVCPPPPLSLSLSLSLSPSLLCHVLWHCVAHAGCAWAEKILKFDQIIINKMYITSPFVHLPHNPMYRLEVLTALASFSSFQRCTTSHLGRRDGVPFLRRSARVQSGLF